MLTNARQTLHHESHVDHDRSSRLKALLFSRPLTALVLLFGVIDLIALSMVLLSSGLHREVFVVTSGSMAPAVKPGDALLIKPGNLDSLRPNDIIVFAPSQSGVLRAHRLIEVVDVKGVPHVRTKGDANSDTDADLTPLMNVRGKSTVTVPKVGYFLNFLAHSKVSLVLFVLPLVVLALREMFDDTAVAPAQVPLPDKAVPS